MLQNQNRETPALLPKKIRTNSDGGHPIYSKCAVNEIGLVIPKLLESCVGRFLDDGDSFEF
jgi:hypothetical protein